MALTEGERLRLQQKARAALEEARRSRYPVVLVLARGEETAPDLWQEFAHSYGLGVLDLLLAAQDAQLRAHFAAWPTLVDWIREQAVAAGGAVVLDLDVVATKWDENTRRRLYEKLLRSATRTRDGSAAAPIVVVSALAMQIDFPKDVRNNRNNNYGRVLELHE